MTTQQALEQFLDYSTYIKNYTPATIRRYKQVIGLYLRESGITEFHQITEKQLKQFMLYGRVERKWSANTFINYHKSFVVFFRWCINEGLMTENYANALELPKKEKKLPPKLSRQQALDLLSFVKNYPYPSKFLITRNYQSFLLLSLLACVRMNY